jgi:hypothetical protein
MKGQKPKLPTHRETAEFWAQNQLKKQDQVNPIHHSQLAYILTEIALIVDPIPDLHVSIMSVGQHYKITVTGFKYLTSYASWGDRFLSKNSRGTFIDSVNKTFTQHSSNGYIKILRVEKMNPERMITPSIGGGAPNGGNHSGAPLFDVRTPNIEKSHEKLMNRSKASKWAKQVAESFQTVLKPQDRPNAEAILTEVALFEVGAIELAIDIIDKIDVYGIVIQGQKAVTDDREWINTFLIERDDSHEFDAIKGCFLQDVTNGSVTMFHLGKIEFKDSSGNFEDQQPILKGTVHPSSRKIRK